MELKFTVSGRVAKPVSEVFEAVVNPTNLSQFFTTGGAKGRIETGVTVSWDFADFPGAFPVEVVEVEKDRKIVLRWAADEGPGKPVGYKTTVTMTFEALPDERTLVSISESGWRENEGALSASYGNCHGWTQMLCSLKAYTERGINLREGMYK
jgi:uncharacterized protein YndB with AHSA1/START domain